MTMNIVSKIFCLTLSLFIAISCFSQISDNVIDKKVDALLARMSLEEKIGQMNQINFEEESDNLAKEIEEGKIGSVINVVDPQTINSIQKRAIENSRLGIPILIGRDVIHGFKTVFPIPLGQAASFNPQLVEEGARIAAIEASSIGIKWTFAPMLDISRDARWGRIAESFGEDTYLTGQMGAAMVRGFQKNGNLSANDAVAACAKHFIGYGAAEGGRDYNSTTITPRLMKNVYLPPFRDAINAGVASVMTSFNDNDGIPSSGNDYLIRNILRQESGFKGLVVSDWTSTAEMKFHGYACDDKHVAELATKAGVEMDMESKAYVNHLAELVKEGIIPVSMIDDAVRNILKLKFQLGLFENPYVEVGKQGTLYNSKHMESAKRMAVESAVLLKNENNILPIDERMTVAVIGPMADAAHDQMGTWVFDGEKEHTVTPLQALKTNYSKVKFIYEPALTHSRDGNTYNFEKAKQAALKADVVIVFLGEESILTGEAHCLSNINLIGVQSDLLKAVKSAGKPVVLVVMAGRPLTIEKDLPFADAVLYNFHPGTMGGPAILDLLYGKENPSGKLPVTFVREVGQIPMYYNHNNTGRPAPENIMTVKNIPLEAEQSSLGNTSYYLDSGKEPLFPFGYGLSYSTFEYSNLKLSSNSIPMGGELKIDITVRNSSSRDGVEVVQLYTRDLVGSIARPVKELKKFQRISLKAGESKTVEFTLSTKDLEFWNRDMQFVAEQGDFDLWVGGDSNATLKANFSIK